MHLEMNQTPPSRTSIGDKPIPRRGGKHARLVLVHQLSEEGKSAEVIANLLNVSLSTVWQYRSNYRAFVARSSEVQSPLDALTGGEPIDPYLTIETRPSRSYPHINLSAGCGYIAPKGLSDSFESAEAAFFAFVQRCPNCETANRTFERVICEECKKTTHYKLQPKRKSNTFIKLTAASSPSRDRRFQTSPAARPQPEALECCAT